MRRRFPRFLLLFAALAASAALVACGAEEEHGLEAIEGEPLELGHTLYNVQITRFLNRNDREDGVYLRGVPEAPAGSEYLGVFMKVSNESEDEASTVPFSMKIRDIRGEIFLPVESPSPFALEFGTEIPPESQIPAPDTPAASGPIKGLMVLFLLEDGAGENRPLELEIPAENGEIGHIELDL